MKKLLALAALPLAGCESLPSASEVPTEFIDGVIALAKFIGQWLLDLFISWWPGLFL